MNNRKIFKSYPDIVWLMLKFMRLNTHWKKKHITHPPVVLGSSLNRMQTPKSSHPPRGTVSPQHNSTLAVWGPTGAEPWACERPQLALILHQRCRQLAWDYTWQCSESSWLGYEQFCKALRWARGFWQHSSEIQQGSFSPLCQSTGVNIWKPGDGIILKKCLK